MFLLIKKKKRTNKQNKQTKKYKTKNKTKKALMHDILNNTAGAGQYTPEESY